MKASSLKSGSSAFIFRSIQLSLTVFVAGFLFGCSPAYRIPLEGSQPLSDTQAIDVSKIALRMAGKNLAEIKPAKCDKKHYFGQNLYDPNHGYILWAWRSDDQYAYFVSLQRSPGYAICIIGKTE